MPFFKRKQKETAHLYKDAAGKERTAYDIGFKGTPEEFRAAHGEAGLHIGKDRLYQGDDDQRAMRKGAIDAFLDGRPETLQSVLADRSHFSVASGSTADGDIDQINPYDVLVTLTHEAKDPVATVERAVAKMAEDEKQKFLNEALCDAVRFKAKDECLAALLVAGANANMDLLSNQKEGYTLVLAAAADSPESAVRMLQASGASFDDALTHYSNILKEHELQRLQAWRATIGGETGPVTPAVEEKPAAPPLAPPPPSPDDIGRKLNSLLARSEALSARFDRMLGEKKAPAAPVAAAPAEEAPAAPPRPRVDYKKILGGP